MQDQSNILKNQFGFTLIEVMMAMVILGIGIMSIVALQARDMAYNNSSRRQTQGYTWAMDRVERLRSISYTDALLSVGERSESQGPYEVRWKVEDNDAKVKDTKKITVTTKWNDREISTLYLIRTKSAI